MSFWTNLLGYQVVWFVAVINSGRGRAWPGVAAACLFAAWQLVVSRRRAGDLRLIAVALLLGSVIDGGLASAGLVQYAAASPALPYLGAPLWILALWVAFALTLTQSLSFLQTRPRLAVVLGAVGAPFAYLAAARGWNALSFADPAWRALLWLATGWGGAVVVLLRQVGPESSATTARPSAPSASAP